MAKRILLSALVNVLGDFVDGLTEENLAVGVWSGKIVLNHVQLNRRAIEKLNLSVTVEHGFIETLEVTIPWYTNTTYTVFLLDSTHSPTPRPPTHSLCDVLQDGPGEPAREDPDQRRVPAGERRGLVLLITIGSIRERGGFEGCHFGAS